MLMLLHILIRCLHMVAGLLNFPPIINNLGSVINVVKSVYMYRALLLNLEWRMCTKKLLTTPFRSLSNVQLTRRTTWSAATGPDQTRNTSSSPPWRSRPKGCWPVAPTTSSPSSPTTTNTIISPGSGASLSRKNGKTDSLSPSCINVFLCFVPPPVSRCHRFISVWIHLWIICWFKLLLSPSIDTPSYSFLFFF